MKRGPRGRKQVRGPVLGKVDTEQHQNQSKKYEVTITTNETNCKI